MKLDFLKSISPLEIVLIVIIGVYIVFAIPTPPIFTPFLDSSLGLATIVIVVIFMIYYTNPILAILSVLAAYELLRRSSISIVPIIKKEISVPFIPSQQQKDTIIQQMNPIQRVTLEEEVIKKMAPLNETDTTTFIETSYKPLPDKTTDCAAYYKCP